jgi:phosphoenolpyruvate-protein kinase (PTS system EI component)
MKKLSLIFSALLLMAGTELISCNTSAEKVEKAEDEVKVANENLDEANAEYLADVEQFKLETNQKIADNAKSIADFNARIATDKKLAKAEYKEKIAALELKNTDMQKKMADYKADGKDGWAKFKEEFNHDMDELGKALKDFTVKND